MDLLQKKITTEQQLAKRSLIWMLICLTVMALIAQFVLFYIHAHVDSLIDTLVNSRIANALFYPSVALPLLQFILLQLLAYILIIVWSRYVAFTVGALFDWRPQTAYWFGVLFWFTVCVAVLMLNHALYPHSFFAAWIPDRRSGEIISTISMVMAMMFISVSSLLACYYMIVSSPKRYIFRGVMSLLIVSLLILAIQHKQVVAGERDRQDMPNIIIIGIDSLRPDFVNKAATPSLDGFLQSSAAFANAYTPLARTFPTWVSILTAKYPKHHGARVNLSDATVALRNETLARRLQAAGYETIYATDEARFADINKQYGFDETVRPARGLVDFILGGLSDFPLTNLLVNLPGGEWLFPYNYANRAAHITYQPARFLQRVDSVLELRNKDKPLFLAIHLCLAHWPFTWADDGDTTDYLPAKYELSVEAVDKQFEQLMQMLEAGGLLKHSLVVLLSDHGTTVGLPGDRLLDISNYRGDKKNLKLISVSRLSSAPEYSLDFKHDYTMNTAYGQGTDVMSLKQYQVVLGFKGYGLTLPRRQNNTMVSLLDVAPTILDYLHLSPLPGVDGMSLYPAIARGDKLPQRPLFIETGDLIDGLNTDNIDVARVIHVAINAYHVDSTNGALVMSAAALKAGVENKQRAVLFGNQMLAYYPAKYVPHLVIDKGTGAAHIEAVANPSYYLTADLRTGKWQFGADEKLKAMLQDFF